MGVPWEVLRDEPPVTKKKCLVLGCFKFEQQDQTYKYTASSSSENTVKITRSN